MPGSGSGPSRRSHTKSRKGCKTCKRRHIRCDENFPQCRNCTKHQVRCDYLDDASQQSPQSQPAGVPSSALPWTSEIEATLDHWQYTGEACIGDFSIDLNSQGIWAEARQHPYLTHALLAFTALSMAWERDSPEIKSLAHQQGAVALRGLQDAIAMAVDTESDAILLASMLLSWQANDWRSWLSLTTGIRTLIGNMRAADALSPISLLVEDQMSVIPQMLHASPQLSSHARNNYKPTLQSVYALLEQLQPYIAGRPEAVWIEQIKDYVERLLSAQAPSSPDEQFNYLYVFRKYLFWVPSLAMQSHSRDTMTLVVLAYLYSTALQLEPLFPDIAPAFCTRLAARPLSQILEMFDALQQGGMAQEQHLMTLTFLMDDPRAIADQYQVRVQASFQQMSNLQTGFQPMIPDMSYSMDAFISGHRSPAFGPAPSHHRMSSDVSSIHSSPYLEVPGALSDSSRGLPGGATWPPAVTLPSMGHSPESEYESYIAGHPSPGVDASGGFVAPQMLWA